MVTPVLMALMSALNVELGKAWYRESTCDSHLSLASCVVPAFADPALPGLV